MRRLASVPLLVLFASCADSTQTKAPAPATPDPAPVSLTGDAEGGWTAAYAGRRDAVFHAMLAAVRDLGFELDGAAPLAGEVTGSRDGERVRFACSAAGPEVRVRTVIRRKDGVVEKARARHETLHAAVRKGLRK